MAQDGKSEEGRSQISESLKDAMKKVLLTGVGTIFLTEETIRSYLGEFKLPKELWGGFLENADKTKKDFLNAFAKEVAQVFSTVDIKEEGRKFLESHKMNLNIEVTFSPLKKKD